MHFKRLLCQFFFFGTLQLAYSQTYLGINGGGGLNNLISLRAAIPIEYTLSKTLSIRTGVAYTQHHNPEILFLLDPRRDYRRATLSYLGIPVLLKLRFELTENFYVYFLSGTQVNYALYFTASYIEDEIFATESIDFKQLMIRRLDVGVNAGIGIEKNISNNCKIYAEISYLLGFSDIDKRPENEIFNEGNVFSLGFILPLSRK